MTGQPDSEYVMRLERTIEQLREMLTFSETRIDSHYKARAESAERKLSAYKNAELPEETQRYNPDPVGFAAMVTEENGVWVPATHYDKLRTYAAAQRVRADQIAAETIEQCAKIADEYLARGCADAIRALSTAEITESVDQMRKDAERYQYIRNRPTPYDDEIWSGIVMREGDDLDAAVDAELERSKPC